MKMLGGVLVLRRVTASHVPALHAQPQMHPGVAHLQALLAALRMRRYLVNVARVCATAHSILLPSHSSSAFRCSGLSAGSGATSRGNLRFLVLLALIRWRVALESLDKLFFRLLPVLFWI